MKAFLIGLGLGIAAGTMIAPSSGDATRERVRERVKGGLRRIRREVRRAGGSGGPIGAVGQSTPARGKAGAAEQRSPRAETDLNSISREELLQVFGIGPVLADKVIQNRPYARDEDVVERGILPQSTFEKLRERLGRRSA